MKKIMVFFSTCKSTKFHADLFRYIKIDCLAIHGVMEQSKRTSTFFQFVKMETGLLLCTNVGARGLDFPHVVCFLITQHNLISWFWSFDLEYCLLVLGLDCAV